MTPEKFHAPLDLDSHLHADPREPFEPLRLECRGRLLKARAEIGIQDNGEAALINVDDEKAADFWCHILITKRQVEWLYRVMHGIEEPQ